MKINQNGFREYDARWLFEKDIDLEGITDLGKGLGTQIIKHTKKTNPRVVVGQDYRSYSEKIKKALTEGLISTGCNVEDVGLALSPMVYFAQFNLNSDAIAMITASHNENGWTGVKMGIKKGLTHAPEEMKELKEITLNKNFFEGNGNEKQIENFDKIYKDDLITKNKLGENINLFAAFDIYYYSGHNVRHYNLISDIIDPNKEEESVSNEDKKKKKSGRLDILKKCVSTMKHYSVTDTSRNKDQPNNLIRIIVKHFEVAVNDKQIFTCCNNIL